MSRVHGIACVNPACTRTTCYAADEILGRKLRLLQGPDAERDVLDRMHAALAAGGPSRPMP